MGKAPRPQPRCPQTSTGNWHPPFAPDPRGCDPTGTPGLPCVSDCAISAAPQPFSQQEFSADLPVSAELPKALRSLRTQRSLLRAGLTGGARVCTFVLGMHIWASLSWPLSCALQHQFLSKILFSCDIPNFSSPLFRELYCYFPGR